MNGLRIASVAAALLATGTLLTSCGSLSRARLAQFELAGLGEPAEARQLAGREPKLPLAWLASAQTAEDPDAGLEWLRRGLAHHPGEPSLLLSRLELLAQLARHDEVVAEARAALAHGQPELLRAELRWRLIGALLARGETAQAEQEVLRLSSDDSEPLMVAAAWARVALAHEAAGRRAGQADDCLDASLAFGGAGVGALRQDTLQEPHRAQAALSLLKRARQRHPRHPDLILAGVVDLMLAGEAAAAQSALSTLPEPLPERLRGDRAALGARLAFLQQDLAGGLQRARSFLDANPADTAMLAVLVEAHLQSGQPPREEVLARLNRAQQLLQRRGGGPSRVLSAMIAQVEQAPAEAAPPGE